MKVRLQLESGTLDLEFDSPAKVRLAAAQLMKAADLAEIGEVPA